MWGISAITDPLHVFMRTEPSPELLAEVRVLDLLGQCADARPRRERGLSEHERENVIESLLYH